MYDLERTKKTIVTMFCLSVVSLTLTFIGLFGGGEELIRDGIMNKPGYTILMFVSAGIFIISLFTGFGFRALSRDLAEELKYIDNKKQN